MPEKNIKTQRLGSVSKVSNLLHDLMKLNPDDATIQREFQRTINVLFEKFPNEMPQL